MLNPLRLLKIGDRIIHLEAITYVSFTPEGATDVSDHRVIEYLESRCDVYLSDGSELYFYGAEAIQAWSYLSVAATSITPREALQ